MKKLIFFARELEIGGVERALVHLLNALADEYAITLALWETRGTLLPELDGRVALRRIPHVVCALAPLRRAGNAALLALWAAKNARRYDFSCAYDTGLLPGCRMARLASKNACLAVHNDYSLLYPDTKELAAFLRRLRAARFHSLVFVSRESRDGVLRCAPELGAKSAVIGNLIGGARLRALAASPCPFQKREGETVFLFLGRLDEEQKRLSRLLEAFRLALRERPALRLLLVGDGPARADCEAYVRAYLPDGRVSFFGAQRNPYPFLAEADCLVLASDFEGFPLVCYEALALGRDLITAAAVSDERIDLRGHAVLCGKEAPALAAAMTAYRRRRNAPLDTDALDRARREAWEALF